MLNRKSVASRGVSVCVVLAAVTSCLLAQTAFAQKGKPGGGTSTSAAVAMLDPVTNTLRISGDGARNRILVDLRDGVAYVSGFGVTSINGSLASLTFNFNPDGFSLLMEGNGGNDDLWVNLNAVNMAAAVQILGGDGGDYISVTTPNGPTQVESLGCIGGGGDDLLTVAVNGSLWIENSLNVHAGDGSDQVQIGTDVAVGNSSSLDGGKRTDQLAISAALFGFSSVTGFESVTNW